MMIKAMEVSGIEGNFRSTCEKVVRVLRVHKESVMAMLEAFVHDPLINWRLLNTTEAATDTALARETEGVATQGGVVAGGGGVGAAVAVRGPTAGGAPGGGGGGGPAMGGGGGVGQPLEELDKVSSGLSGGFGYRE